MVDKDQPLLLPIKRAAKCMVPNGGSLDGTGLDTVFQELQPYVI